MKSHRQITVLIADDHALIRRELCGLLERDGEIRVVGQARNGREAIEMARECRPQIVLMDIAMPLVNGLEATRRIKEENPSSKIIVLSAHVECEYADWARKAGANGYIAKLESAEALSWAVHQVANGRRLFHPVVSANVFNEGEGNSEQKGPARNGKRRLTGRESDLLGLIAKGLPKMRMAAKLHVGRASIEQSVGALMRKLGVPNVAGLVAYAAAFHDVGNDVQLKIT